MGVQFLVEYFSLEGRKRILVFKSLKYDAYITKDNN